MKVLGLVVARGGSKGLPGKNVMMAAGKPLIAWSIEAAKKSTYLDRLIISSDDAGIISVAREFGCEAPFIRPKHLATDAATTYDVAIHAIDSLEEHFDILVVLQPTSPLRTDKDIDKCVELSLISGSCVSLVEADKSPYWMYELESSVKMSPILKPEQAILRRQDAPPVFLLNGAVYGARTKWLRDAGSFIDHDTVPYVMPKNRSLDIDSSEDLDYFEILVTRDIS